MSQAASEYETRRLRGLTGNFSGDAITVRQLGNHWEASLTGNPGVFETSAVSGHDAIGRLVERVWPVRRSGVGVVLTRTER